MSSVSNVCDPPNAIACEFTVMLELASLAFAIEPANIAFVIPLAFTLRASELISIEESSTPTASVTSPEVPPPVKPSPATTEVISALLVFAIVNVPAASS